MEIRCLRAGLLSRTCSINGKTMTEKIQGMMQPPFTGGHICMGNIEQSQRTTLYQFLLPWLEVIEGRLPFARPTTEGQQEAEADDRGSRPKMACIERQLHLDVVARVER